MKQFALFSPVVPPVRSGQTVILYRLLEAFDPQRYIMVANAQAQARYKSVIATPHLSADVFLIEPRTSRPIPLPGKKYWPMFPYYLLAEVYGRAVQIAAILKRNPVRALIGCSGDFYSLPAAFIAARLARVPFVTYFFDDFLYQCPRYLRPAAFVMERVCVRGAHEVIVTNERFVEELQRRHGVTAKVIHNAVDLDAPPSRGTAKKLLPEGVKNIVYAGTLYNAHYDAFHNLLRAMERLGRDDVRLNLFTFQSAEDLASVGIQSPLLVLHEYRPQAEILAAQQEADLLFLPLAFESPLKTLLRTAAPGKTAEYLAWGMPILVHAPADTFISQYFRRHECGFVADSPDVAALAEVLRQALDDTARRQYVSAQARKRAEADFDIRKEQRKLHEIIDLAAAACQASA